MRVRLMTAEGRTYEMPPPLAYRLSWTGGVPCDALEVTTAYDGTLAEVLPLVCRFAAYEGERLLLRGVVDEYEAAVEPEGATLTVCGRGMLALLLDNESEAAFYQRATVEELIRNHVAPYGLDWEIRRRPEARESYQVSSGSSQWRALSDFTQYAGGFDPYMTAEGVLVVGERRGSGRETDLGQWPILSCRRREKRYGVISEVLVRDKSRGVSQRVVNQDLAARGGSARRVVYTPGRSTWAAMRYTGSYQIRRSREGAAAVEAVLAGAADLRPGDRGELTYSPLEIHGRYDVAAVERRMDEGGLTTAVTLWEM